MSLFKVRDLWTAQCGEDESFDQSCIIISNLGGRCDKIIVGSHSGYLRLYEPSLERLEDGKMVGYKATDLLIEMLLPHPILQIGVGKLVSGSPNEQLSILHPRSVAVYSFVTKVGAAEHGDQSRLVLAYENQLRRSAFSMVIGPFGGVKGRDFLCVQSLDGTVSFFEQETFAFTRFLPGFLLPGPMVYQSLAEAGDATDQESTTGRRLQPDWTYNLGEAALDAVVVTWSNSYCDIVILGERNYFCLKDNGTLKFMKRLELSWSAQLISSPVAVKRAAFELMNQEKEKSILNGALVLLSDSGELQCCYLGTEPSLFVAPPVERHVIDYAEAAKELVELQKLINSAAEREVKVLVNVNSQLEPCPFPHNIDEEGIEIPMCRVSVELIPHSPLSKVQVSVIVQPPLTVSQVSHTITSLCERTYIVAYIYMEQSCDVPTLDVRIVTSYLAGVAGFPRVLHNVVHLPLKLVAIYTPPTKEADFKVTLNTNQPVVNLSQLFPEFVGEGAMSANSTAAGFHCYGGRGSVVTILGAKSSQRYRLQCDSLPSLYLLTSQLVERLHRHFSKQKGFSCSYASSLPLHELFSEIGTHFVFREKARKIQKAVQFRAIQRRLLSKFKDKTPTPLTNLDMLLKETYQQILMSADEVEEIQQALSRFRCQLSCVVRLILLMLKLMNTTSEEDYSNLQAALSSTGWEEVTDAALSYLLRTSLSKGSKNNQRLAPINLDPMKDIARFKKHISSALDRAAKGSFEKKENNFDTAKTPKAVSPIPEDAEVTNEEESIVPVGSQYGERIASANPRGRSAALTRARRTAKSPSVPATASDASNKSAAEIPHVKTESLAVPQTGGIEAPAELFPSADDDIW
ncbi:Protein PTHB1 [Blattella germanica]|nr:Protein PTHB1 [Blattella germanica]